MYPNMNLSHLIKDDGIVYIERIQAFLCATEFAEHDDSNETFFVSSIYPAKTGKTPVYYIHDDDWGLHPYFESIEMMENVGVDGDKSDDDAFYEFINPLEDPENLFFRSEWLLNTFLMLFYGYTINSWDALKEAPSFDDYDKERNVIAIYPHLAVYWLWSHALFGNDEALAETMELCRESMNPVVMESISLIKSLTTGKTIDITKGYKDFLYFVRPLVPELLLSKKTVEKRNEANEKALDAVSKEEKEALKILKTAAKSEPTVKEALEKFKKFDQGQHQDAFSKLNDIHYQNEFAKTLDQRFKPLIKGRIERSIGLEDSDPRAVRGMVLAWATLSENYEEFCKVVTDNYINSFGDERLEEYYFALVQIDDVAAISKLKTYAKPYAQNYKNNKENNGEVSFRILLNFTPAKFRTIDEFDELLISYLNGMDYEAKPDIFTGYEIIRAQEAAIVCGEMGCTKAAHGIANLIRVTATANDYVHFKTMLALYKICGNQYADMIMGLYEQVCSQPLLSTHSDVVAKHTFNLISYESILLAMNPQNIVLKQRIVQRVEDFLKPETTLNSTDLQSIATVIRAAQFGNLEMLKDSVKKIANAKLKMSYEYMNNQAEEVKTLAREWKI